MGAQPTEVRNGVQALLHPTRAPRAPGDHPRLSRRRGDRAEHALRHTGYEIVDVESAEEAIELLDGHDANFDIVFSDIVLPGKSGVELAEEVQARGSDVRMLLASGDPDRRVTGSHPQELGIPFLCKPYSIRGLLETVREVLC